MNKTPKSFDMIFHQVVFLVTCYIFPIAILIFKKSNDSGLESTYFNVVQKNNINPQTFFLLEI